MKRLNYTELLNHFDNDEDLFKRSRDEFCKELPLQVKQIKKACESSNWPEVYRLAHKVHGASANFLKNSVADLAKQMEVLAQRNQTTGIHALAKYLEQECAEMCSELKTFSKKKAAS